MTAVAKKAKPKIGKRIPRYARKQPAARRQQLIDAAIRCLGDGGMSAFTIDRICREARVSRGLINHHFAGKDELLVCVYETMTEYLAEAPRAWLTAKDLTPVERLNGLIEASFEEDAFDRSQLRAWLALWGEVSTNIQLRALHRKRFEQYRKGLTREMSAIAKERGRDLDAKELARLLIALIDGLWLEWCLSASARAPRDAKAACFTMIEAHLGPIKH